MARPHHSVGRHSATRRLRANTELQRPRAQRHGRARPLRRSVRRSTNGQRDGAPTSRRTKSARPRALRTAESAASTSMADGLGAVARDERLAQLEVVKRREPRQSTRRRARCGRRSSARTRAPAGAPLVPAAGRRSRVNCEASSASAPKTAREQRRVETEQERRAQSRARRSRLAACEREQRDQHADEQQRRRNRPRASPWRPEARDRGTESSTSSAPDSSSPRSVRLTASSAQIASIGSTSDRRHVA